MDFVSPWMDKIRTTCQRAEIDHIDVIIDQCAVNFSVLPALTTFSNPMMWQSLYQGLPEDIYPEDAPVLVRVDLSDAEHVQWLNNLAAEMMESAPLLICGSCWPFEQLVIGSGIVLLRNMKVGRGFSVSGIPVFFLSCSATFLMLSSKSNC